MTRAEKLAVAALARAALEAEAAALATAEAGCDGDEVVSSLAEAQALLWRVMRVVEGKT